MAVWAYGPKILNRVDFVARGNYCYWYQMVHVDESFAQITVLILKT